MFLVSVTTSGTETQWTPDGNAYYSFTKNGIEVVDLVDPGKIRLL